MGIGNRIGVAKAVLLLAAGAAGGGAALAVASVPDSNGTFHACVQLTVSGSATVPAAGPNLTMIDPSAGQHCNGSNGPSAPAQTEISWNATGPQGPPGANGTDGSPGAPGTSVTIAGGRTLTLAGGQVVTVAGNLGGTTIASPTINPRGRGFGQVSLPGSGIPGFTVLGISTAPSTSARGSETGKASIHEITLTKRVDRASRKLFTACASGQHIPKVTITLRKASGQAYLVYTLSDVLVSSYQTVAAGKSGQADTPVEQLSLNFTKVEIKY